jgi:hypothetical protein
VIDVSAVDPDRFWSKVARGSADKCWPWLAAFNGPYGAFAVRRIPYGAHRIAYLLTYGQPTATSPSGRWEVHHACGNRACCNPAHLRLMGATDHRQLHGSTGCPRHGDADWRTPPSGHGYCGICNRARVAAWKANQPTRTW